MSPVTSTLFKPEKLSPKNQPVQNELISARLTGPCTPKNCILYITEKGGILVLGICILYINPQSEYFGILLSLKSVYQLGNVHYFYTITCKTKVCQYIVKWNLYFIYWTAISGYNGALKSSILVWQTPRYRALLTTRCRTQVILMSHHSNSTWLFMPINLQLQTSEFVDCRFGLWSLPWLQQIQKKSEYSRGADSVSLSP